MAPVTVLQVLTATLVVVSAADVTTPAGRVSGLELDVLGTKVNAFLGIPFAKPPTGDRRFKPAEALPPWNGVYNATRLPESCVQNVNADADEFYLWAINTNTSEDCLYLSVWQPDPKPTNASVMVWIHGGAFQTGSSTVPTYDGAYLAATEGVVVVGLQYRVSTLGFLYAGTEDAPGNAGLTDQVLALKWVKNNIAAFGETRKRARAAPVQCGLPPPVAHTLPCVYNERTPGSHKVGHPGQRGLPKGFQGCGHRCVGLQTELGDIPVTLFGESAGGISVAFHLVSPGSRDLFLRAIMQSGTALMTFGLDSKDAAYEKTLEIAGKVGCPTDQGKAKMVECLQGKDGQQLVSDSLLGFTAFYPVEDGTVITESPFVSYEKGNFKKADILLGSNENEGTYFFLENGAPGFSAYTESLITREQFLAGIWYTIAGINDFAVDAAAFQYTDWENLNSPSMHRDALDRLYSDYFFFCPDVMTGRGHVREGATAYMYRFAHRSSANPFLPWVGVFHGEELPFVFGLPLEPLFGFTEAEKNLTLRMMRHWANFARTGNPNSNNGTMWSPFRAGVADGRYLVLDTGVPRMLPGPSIENCAFWENYVFPLMNKTEALKEALKDKLKTGTSGAPAQHLAGIFQAIARYLCALLSQPEKIPNDCDKTCGTPMAPVAILQVLMTTLVVPGLFHLPAGVSAADVTAPAGRIFGLELDVLGTKVNAFLGIPFAKPPTGERRFKPAEALPPWSGVYNATRKPQACLQNVRADEYRLWAINTTTSEDCLYLSVWQPDPKPTRAAVMVWIYGGSFQTVWQPDSKPTRAAVMVWIYGGSFQTVWQPDPKPTRAAVMVWIYGGSFQTVWQPDSKPTRAAVMVWIYGGSFQTGSSTAPTYDGRYLAATEGVVVVGLQYRLSTLGFLYAGTEDAPGNAGLTDQVLALKWVQNNIAAFGGDPQKVTLFGESSGGTSVAFHLLSPGSSGLFLRAILQSGTALITWGRDTKDAAYEKTTKIAKAVGCPTDQGKAKMVECFRNKDGQQLVSSSLLGYTYFYPTEDGTVIPESPFVSYKEGNFKKADILIGSNENEGTYFLVDYAAPGFSADTESLITREQYLAGIPYMVAEINNFAVDAAAFQYTDWENLNSPSMHRDALDRLYGDFYFVCPDVMTGRAHVREGATAYMYRFAHRASVSPFPPWMGVIHGEELPFVFGLPLDPGFGFNETEKNLTRRVMRHWANFARTGNPNSQNETVWSPFSVTDGRYLVLDTGVPRMLPGPSTENCAFWENYVTPLMNKTNALKNELKACTSGAPEQHLAGIFQAIARYLCALLIQPEKIPNDCDKTCGSGRVFGVYGGWGGEQKRLEAIRQKFRSFARLVSRESSEDSTDAPGSPSEQPPTENPDVFEATEDKQLYDLGLEESWVIFDSHREEKRHKKNESESSDASFESATNLPDVLEPVVKVGNDQHNETTVDIPLQTITPKQRGVSSNENNIIQGKEMAIEQDEPPTSDNVVETSVYSADVATGSQEEVSGSQAVKTDVYNVVDHEIPEPQQNGGHFDSSRSDESLLYVGDAGLKTNASSDKAELEPPTMDEHDGINNGTSTFVPPVQERPQPVYERKVYDRSRASFPPPPPDYETAITRCVRLDPNPAGFVLMPRLPVGYSPVGPGQGYPGDFSQHGGVHPPHPSNGFPPHEGHFQQESGHGRMRDAPFEQELYRHEPGFEQFSSLPPYSHEPGSEEVGYPSHEDRHFDNFHSRQPHYGSAENILDMQDPPVPLSEMSPQLSNSAMDITEHGRNARSTDRKSALAGFLNRRKNLSGSWGSRARQPRQSASSVFAGSAESLPDPQEDTSLRTMSLDRLNRQKPTSKRTYGIRSSSLDRMLDEDGNDLGDTDEAAQEEETPLKTASLDRLDRQRTPQSRRRYGFKSTSLQQPSDNDPGSFDENGEHIPEGNNEDKTPQRTAGSLDRLNRQGSAYDRANRVKAASLEEFRQSLRSLTLKKPTGIEGDQQQEQEHAEHHEERQVTTPEPTQKTPVRKNLTPFIKFSPAFLEQERSKQVMPASPTSALTVTDGQQSRLDDARQRANQLEELLKSKRQKMEEAKQQVRKIHRNLEDELTKQDQSVTDEDESVVIDFSKSKMETRAGNSRRIPREKTTSNHEDAENKKGASNAQSTEVGSKDEETYNDAKKILLRTEGSHQDQPVAPSFISFEGGDDQPVTPPPFSNNDPLPELLAPPNDFNPGNPFDLFLDSLGLPVMQEEWIEERRPSLSTIYEEDEPLSDSTANSSVIDLTMEEGFIVGEDTKDERGVEEEGKDEKALNVQEVEVKENIEDSHLEERLESDEKEKLEDEKVSENSKEDAKKEDVKQVSETEVAGKWKTFIQQ
ncbi:hypothetical protein Bbelb_236170 [Branchiostoma belcheri]|nr:hypothetical protein Bbelb_236170 [Branchiostoma belcheri]